MTDVLKKLGKEEFGYLNDEIGSQYYRIDLGYYYYPYKRNNKLNKYEWDADVVIEHENDTKDWYDEFVKLVHINCGLKVIITYYKFGDKENDSPKGKHEKEIKKLYANRKYKNDKDEWLFIFGPYESSNQDFVAYKFSGDKFCKLKDKKILSRLK
jgi:hypothetical protein